MKPTHPYPSLRTTTDSTSTLSHAGGLLLTETVRATSLGQTISAHLARWRKPRALHDPGKICTDLAIALALGGNCLADTALLRNQPDLYGPVASDPTISRTIAALAAQPDKAIAAIRTARASARSHAWHLAGNTSPAGDEGRLTLDLDATLVTAHSDKENAAPTWKKTYGFHPLCAFIDHGEQGTGEAAAALLRPGNAGSNTAADHITVAAAALKQLPRAYRRGRKTLIRTDTAGGTHTFLDWVTKRGRWLSYSVGMTITDQFHTAIDRVPASAWTAAYNADGQAREGAWVCEITDMVDLTAWPAGMRLIVRKERPHPGAQLRITDREGNRLTAFATNTPSGQLADLELRHRRRARAEDRIRAAKDTGLANLPLHGFAANQVWIELVMLALDLLTWAQMLALAGHAARRWEPKRLRLRLFSVAARLVRTGRRRMLRYNRAWPWAELLSAAIAGLRALPAPT